MKGEYLMYPNNKIYPMSLNTGDNRQFLFPFLLGGLAGGAAIGLTRPRPIYNVAPYPNYPPRPYGNYSYNYYIPGPYGY